MPVSPKLLIAGIAVAAGAAVMLSGGDANASGRDPWTKPIATPQTPEEIEAAKQTVCACFRGGAREVDELTACALKQVYGGDVDWSQLMTPVEGDDPSLAHVVSYFRQLSVHLIDLPESEHASWCGDVGPVIPGVIVDPPPPAVDPKEYIRKRWSELKSEKALPGYVYAIPQGHNGIEALAKQVLANIGIPNPSYQKLVKPLMVSLSVGPRWNRPLYARNAKDGEWYSYEGQNIKPAWLPRNQDANAAVIQGHAPERNIFNDGRKKGPGSSYGYVFVTAFNKDIARKDGVFVVDDDADYDPPAEFLDALGM